MTDRIAVVSPAESQELSGCAGEDFLQPPYVLRKLRCLLRGLGARNRVSSYPLSLINHLTNLFARTCVVCVAHVKRSIIVLAPSCRQIPKQTQTAAGTQVCGLQAAALWFSAWQAPQPVHMGHLAGCQLCWG
jgi:hypothetical protein